MSWRSAHSPHGRWFDLGVALSLANLLCAAAWVDLLNSAPLYRYLERSLTRHAVAAVPVSIIAMAIALYGLAQIARRLQFTRYARWLFFVAMVVAAENMRGALIPHTLPPLKRVAVRLTFEMGFVGKTVVVATLTAAVALSIRWGKQLSRGLALGLLFLVPFAAIVLARSVLEALWWVPRPPPHRENIVTVTDGSRAMRSVVWLIFDELDEGVALDTTLPGSRKELGALRHEAFVATAARSPANATLESIPALLTGEPVVTATPVDDSTLTLSLRDLEQKSFISLPNVIDDARGLGMRTALVGWCHPYDRLFTGSLDTCHTYGSRPTMLEPQPTVLRTVAQHLLYVWPLARDSYYPRRHRHMMADIDETIAKWEGFQLAIFHMSIPHAPTIFDAERGEFSTLDRGIGGAIIHNTALVDYTIGQIRRSLDARGLWDSAAIIVSSDHGTRRHKREPRGRHVPFFVKLPDQHTGAVYEKPINTLITRALVSALATGKVSTPEELAAWLDAQPDAQAP